MPAGVVGRVQALVADEPRRPGEQEPGIAQPLLIPEAKVAVPARNGIEVRAERREADPLQRRPEYRVTLPGPRLAIPGCARASRSGPAGRKGRCVR